jgi:hypothetical protein
MFDFENFWENIMVRIAAVMEVNGYSTHDQALVISHMQSIKDSRRREYNEYKKGGKLITIRLKILFSLGFALTKKIKRIDEKVKIVNETISKWLDANLNRLQ